MLEIVNCCFLIVKIILDDIEVSWVGLWLLIVVNGSFDYNGGNLGKISDKSFKEVIKVVD